MNGTRGVITAAILLYLAGIAQAGLAPGMQILGASPDFLLVCLGTLGLFCSRRGGMLLGFFSGLLLGGLSGANLQHYIATRTVAGLLVGWANMLEVEPTYITAVVSSVLVTIVASLGLLFLAPPPGIGAYLADTIRTAMYNGVLAVPTYALLKRVLPPTIR